MVLEIRPDVPFGKDVGVARLLAETDVDRALYMGDDRTDADAFAELHAALGDGRLTHTACIGVASDETPPEVQKGADLLVDGPDGVREILSRLARA
jgi:trehalose 6-phosphate phosphatase